MKPTVLLFDIDGTLVSTGGAGHRSMVGAFARVHGAPDVFADISFAGMTDRSIARYGLRKCLPTVSEEVPKAEGYRVLPGVQALLASLAGEARVAIGLGTGNVRRGAEVKLTRGAIYDAFAFGGFGCDAEDRTELIRTGAERGAGRLGVPLAECRVVVIGDTPKDIAAARGIGAACVAVATGSFRERDLEAHEPDHVVATLEADGVREMLLRR